MNIHNIIIIGSGPAGLTAAVYAARAQLHPIVFEGSTPGGQLMGTTTVENWPGTQSILGPELMKLMKEHALTLGTKLIKETIESVDFSHRPFELITHRKNRFLAQTVIIATGATPRRLDCPGASDYYGGKGVSSCAVCDGAFYRDKPVIIVGGGDTAMEDASFMTNFTKDITIVHIRDQLTASATMQDRVRNNPAIKILYNATVSKIHGDGSHVQRVTITDQTTGSAQDLPANAVFVAIGLYPNTALFKDKLEMNQAGYIVPKEHTQTSVPGVFVAGDVADSRYRQAITSAGSGCMAALDAERFLKESSHTHLKNVP